MSEFDDLRRIMQKAYPKLSKKKLDALIEQVEEDNQATSIAAPFAFRYGEASERKGRAPSAIGTMLDELVKENPDATPKVAIHFAWTRHEKRLNAKKIYQHLYRAKERLKRAKESLKKKD